MFITGSQSIIIYKRNRIIERMLEKLDNLSSSQGSISVVAINKLFTTPSCPSGDNGGYVIKAIIYSFFPWTTPELIERIKPKDDGQLIDNPRGAHQVICKQVQLLNKLT